VFVCWGSVLVCLVIRTSETDVEWSEYTQNLLVKKRLRIADYSVGGNVVALNC